MISLNELAVTQAELRHEDDVSEMVEHVACGGFWTAEFLAAYSQKKQLLRVSPLIAVSVFQDGRKFIHDGHHRSVATVLGGRDYLRDDEYEVTSWRYEQYLRISYEKGWYTPFDPRRYVRIADFGDFKHRVREMFEKDRGAAEQFYS